MADARKRTRKTGRSGGRGGRTGEPGEAEGRAVPRAVVEARPQEPAATSWVSREEPMFFPPDEPAEVPRAPRIALPASGLAADILAMAEAADVSAVPPPTSVGVPAPAVPVSATDARSHNISFFAASPVREERKAVEATEHLATFYLSREEYGVDVRLVQEIIRVTEITPVPRAPEFIKGVINLRGRIIPVVDLKRKLNLGEVAPTRQSRIVVVKLKDRLIGLLVDGASQVLKVPVASIEAAPEEVVEIDANYIRGVAKLTDRLIILMDLQKILSAELRDGTSA